MSDTTSTGFTSLPIPPCDHALDAFTYAFAALPPMPQSPLVDRVDEVAEFDTLLNALDLGVINRVGWDRLKTLIARAIVEAGDAEAGLSGYIRILGKWRTCPAYDGRT